MAAGAMRALWLALPARGYPQTRELVEAIQDWRRGSLLYSNLSGVAADVVVDADFSAGECGAAADAVLRVRDAGCAFPGRARLRLGWTCGGAPFAHGGDAAEGSVGFGRCPEGQPAWEVEVPDGYFHFFFESN